MGESYNICLDIGGTKTLGAIFDSKKNIIYRLKKKTKSGGDDAGNVENLIISVVDEMIKESGVKKSQIHAAHPSSPVLTSPSISEMTSMSAFLASMPTAQPRAMTTLSVSSSAPAWAAG